MLSHVNYRVVGEGMGSGNHVVHFTNLKQLGIGRVKSSGLFIVAEESAGEREVCKKKVRRSVLVLTLSFPNCLDARGKI